MALPKSSAPVAGFFFTPDTPDPSELAPPEAPPEAPPLPEGFALLGPVSSLRKAQEWLFVLRSVDLDGVVREPERGRWGILVMQGQYARALETLRTYEAENRNWPPPQRRDTPLYERSSWAALTFAALVAFFLATGPAQAHSVWFQLGTADSFQILHGKPWQAVTALTLHADGSHVLGNAAAGTIFLTAVHRRLGAGMGTFVVLAAGAMGNVLNALWHGGEHWSIGASTAVFAAVGVLAATQMVLNRERSAQTFVSTWAPILGGLALLGTLGAGGGHTDLHAHGFGFLAGVVLGALAAFPVRRRAAPLPSGVQAGFAALSLASTLGAWALALVRRLLHRARRSRARPQAKTTRSSR